MTDTVSKQRSAQVKRWAPFAHAVFGILLVPCYIVMFLSSAPPPVWLAAPTVFVGTLSVARPADSKSRGIPDVVVAAGFVIWALWMNKYGGSDAEPLWWAAVAPIGLALSFIRFWTEPPGTPRPKPHEATLGELLGIPDSAIAAQGANGMVGLDGDRLRIRHQGVRAGLGMGFGAGVKEISVTSITATQWKDAGDLWLGFFSVSYIGGVDPSGGLLTDVGNENTVTFTKAQQPAFEALRRAVEAQRAPMSVGANLQPALVSASASTAVSAPDDVATKVRSLAELRDAGLLTIDEFEARKQQLLDRL